MSSPEQNTNSALPERPELPYPALPDVWETLQMSPEIDSTAWIAPSATVQGRVKVGRLSSVYHGSVVRGDGEAIIIGDETNIQDLSVLHTDYGAPCVIGNRVTVGHRAIVHACTIEDEVMVGMGAIVLTGCHIGKGALIAAGAVVKEGEVVPPHTLWAGTPAKQLRELNADQQKRLAHAYQHYANSAVLYKAHDEAQK